MLTVYNIFSYVWRLYGIVMRLKDCGSRNFINIEYKTYT